MLEMILDFLLQIVARFVGVTTVALAVWLASGFRKSYLREWKRLFAKHTGVYSAIDILGILVIFGFVAAVALVIYLALT